MATASLVLDARLAAHTLDRATEGWPRVHDTGGHGEDRLRGYFPLALSLSLLALASCEFRQRPPTSPSLSVRGPTGGDNEEELIGDTLWGETIFYQMTTGGPRARYRIQLDGDTTDIMYYLPSAWHPWGWFTSSPDEHNCFSDMREHHDVTGDGVAEISDPERHCVRNGQHDVTVLRVTWNEDGSAIVASQTAFRRRVAMLGYLGAFEDHPQSTTYHDVIVTLDGTEGLVQWQGDLRAGNYFMGREFPDSLYAQNSNFLIGGSDTLWFMSTFVATGQEQRPWYLSPKAVLTQFNFDFVYTPEAFSGGVNSKPGTQTSAALRTFAARADPYRVVGRTIAPFHLDMSAGSVRTAQSIYVTAVGPDACFSVSGPQMPDSVLTFNGDCSTAQGTREFRWSFGDNTGVEWTPDSAVVHHVYGATGSYAVTLRVRRAGSTEPVDSASQTVVIATTPPLYVSIVGPDWITTSGTYTWNSVPHDGVPPYTNYRWYYQQGGSPEDLVGTRNRYSRYISVQGDPYVFRRRNRVQDALPSEADDTLWVDVVPGGGSYASIGLLDAANVCRALPLTARARRAAHAAVVKRGRWPVPCLVPTP